MNDSIKRIERAVESIEYKTLSTVSGAALAGAVLAPTKEARERALDDYRQVLAKQAELVRKPR